MNRFIQQRLDGEPGPGILSTIGNTPLLRLERVIDGDLCLMGKLELFNPGGSIKDRVAFNVLTQALQDGSISAHTTVIESSSGNMGIGLAQVCSYLGLRFICVVDSRTTPLNIQILRAYGAEVEIITIPDPDLLSARIKRVKTLCAEIPDSFWCNQYANLNNPRAHYHTMREISEQSPAPIDYLFCATSSCGTLRGCAEYIRDHQLPTKIIAVDAEGSIIFGTPPGPRLLPGHGAGRVPEIFRPGLAEEVVHVSDLDCVIGCHRLLEREAILAGASSGGVISAIEKMQPQLPPGARCVAILCDRGERYLDTVYSDEWIEQHFDARAQQRIFRQHLAHSV